MRGATTASIAPMMREYAAKQRPAAGPHQSVNAIADPEQEQVARPISRTAAKIWNRFRHSSLVGHGLSPTSVRQRNDLGRRHGHAMRACGGQFLDLMIAPAGADRTDAGASRAAHVPAGVADEDGLRRLRPRLGHRRQRHRRVRLGRVADRQSAA